MFGIILFYKKKEKGKKQDLAVDSGLALRYYTRYY